MSWTQEQKDWLRNNYPLYSRPKLTALFNQTFNRTLSVGGMATYCKARGYKSPAPARWEKGHQTWNKGKKGYMGANRTSFTKGNRPQNWQPVGTERITKDGYLEVKVKEPRTWELKHRLVWQKHHGEIPPKHCIRFLDGNKTNIVIENLICVPFGVNVVINKHHPADTADPELNKAIILTESVRQEEKAIKKRRSKKK